MTVRVYVDGAIKARGKPECRLGMGCVFHHLEGETILQERCHSVAEDNPDGTNILAELKAIQIALEYLPAAKRARIQLVVVTDSQWSERAIKREYRTTEHVPRQDEIRRLLAQFKSWRIDWVRGHATDPHNRKANRLAQEAAGTWTGRD